MTCQFYKRLFLKSLLCYWGIIATNHNLVGKYITVENINKQAPITYKIRINQQLFMFILI